MGSRPANFKYANTGLRATTIGYDFVRLPLFRRLPDGSPHFAPLRSYRGFYASLCHRCVMRLQLLTPAHSPERGARCPPGGTAGVRRSLAGGRGSGNGDPDSPPARTGGTDQRVAGRGRASRVDRGGRAGVGRSPSRPVTDRKSDWQRSETVSRFVLPISAYLPPRSRRYPVPDEYEPHVYRTERIN